MKKTSYENLRRRSELSPEYDNNLGEHCPVVRKIWVVLQFRFYHSRNNCQVSDSAYLRRFHMSTTSKNRTFSNAMIKNGKLPST